MSPRKPADPRDDIPIPEALRNLPETGRTPAEEPISSPDDAAEDEPQVNVEVESGPVDREGRDDPLPEAP